MSVALDRGAVETLNDSKVDFAESRYDEVKPERHLDLGELLPLIGKAQDLMNADKGMKADLDAARSTLAERFSEWHTDKAKLVTEDPRQLEARASSLMNEVRRHLDDIHGKAPGLNVGEYALSLTSLMKGVAMDLRDAEGRNRGLVPAIWQLEGHSRNLPRDVLGEVRTQRDPLRWACDGIRKLDVPADASPGLRAALDRLGKQIPDLQNALKKVSPKDKPNSQSRAAANLASQLEHTLGALSDVRKNLESRDPLRDSIEQSRRRLEAAGSSLADMLRQMNAAG
jgi:hypothetical protein